MLPKKTSQSIALCLFFAVSLTAQVNTEKQVRLVVQGSSPKASKGSFAEKPKVIHRFGDKFARIEEELNPETNLKLLIVTKAPDTWMVNLVDGTGNHMVDPDPKGKVKFPIFPKEGMPAGYPPPMEDLEFGREALYFDSFKAPYTPMKTPRGEMVKQVLGTDDWTLILVRKEEKGAPVFLFLTNKEGIVTVFEYLEYTVLSEPDLKVFDTPKNVKFREQPAS